MLSGKALAIFISILGLSLILSVGGSVFLSLSVARATKESICSGFEYFIHKPVPPKNTPLYRREARNYTNLIIFEHKIGCR